MKSRDYVYETIEHGRSGSRSSINELLNEIRERHDVYMTYQLVQKYRKEWQRENDEDYDARTHEDIPRRNMLNDKKITRDTFDKTVSFFDQWELSSKDVKQLLKLTRKFHSIDQLQTFLSTYASRSELVAV